MHDIILIAMVGALNIVCFFTGVKAGRKEEIKAPSVSRFNPVNLYTEHQEKREAKKEMEKIETILSNIERYDGTEAGQEDV